MEAIHQPDSIAGLPAKTATTKQAMNIQPTMEVSKEYIGMGLATSTSIKHENNYLHTDFIVALIT
jgi:hypothetical protein